MFYCTFISSYTFIDLKASSQMWRKMEESKKNISTSLRKHISAMWLKAVSYVEKHYSLFIL